MYIYIREVGRLGLYRETGQPGSESFSARVPIICAGRTAASKGGSEAGTPIGGGAAARASARHAPACTDAAHRSRTHRNDPGCGYILRGVPHNEARFRAVGSGGVPGVADVGRREFHLQFSVREDAAKLLPSGRGKEEPRLPLNLRGRSRGGVPTGGGIHAMVTHQGVRILVPRVF